MSTKEAASAHGELYEIAGETPSTIETGDADVYVPWITGSQGLVDSRGLVRAEGDSLDTWSDAVGYAIGATVSHSSHNWIHIAQEYDAYDPSTTYSPDDTCTYGGYDWICLVEATGILPESGSTYWAVDGIADEPDEETDYWTDLGPRGDRLIIDEDGAGIYRVSARILFTGTADSVFTWAIHKNDTADAKLLAAITAVDGVEHTAVIQGLTRLAAGDILDLRVAGSVGTETVTILSISLTAERIYEE